MVLKKKSVASGPVSEKPKVKAFKVPKEFVVRPFSLSSKACMKVYINEEVAKTVGLNIGDLVYVGTTTSKGVVGTVAVCQRAAEVVQMSASLRRLGGIHLGARVTLDRYNLNLEVCKRAKVAVSGNGEPAKYEAKIQKILQEIGVVVAGLQFQVDETLQVTILDLDETEEDEITESLSRLSLAANPEAEDHDTDQEQQLIAPYYIYDRQTSKVTYETADAAKIGLMYLKHSGLSQLAGFSRIGGLDQQIEQIKQVIQVPLQYPGIFRHFNVKPSRGILLYGGPGTGKSMLLEAIQNEYFDKVHMIKVDASRIISKYMGDAELSLEEIFKEAKRYQPSIVFFDEIDSLLPSRSELTEDSDLSSNRLVTTLMVQMDGLEIGSRILVVGATNRPNRVDRSLRTAGRFDKEIEVPIPGARARLAVLEKILGGVGGAARVPGEFLEVVAGRTHGYVGADLVALVRGAVMATINRGLVSGEFELRSEDIEASLAEIRPSAMKEILLEMPKVYWRDIGGQAQLKRKLREMVQLPLEAPASFQRLGVQAPRGILLYGPPGCSKTLTAKALATESDLNFLVVKGAEIFNKYLGESERTIREVFRKARAAAPSIIFFDEIDAIAGSRTGDDNSHSTVLTTLLNEIDGVEELNGVVIVAATNKPDTIDPALLRPGRLDRHIYVGPPELEARRHIMEIKTRRFGVQDRNLLDELAAETLGFSGAEVVLLCQEAGINAIMENPKTTVVTRENFQQALSNIQPGITEEMVQYYQEFASSG